MEKKDRGRYAFTAKKLCYTAVMVVVNCLCAWLSVPIGEIPVTLQTFAVCLTACMLGWKLGTLSMLAYILLGFIGVPVFSGFTGGVSKLVTPTGGYIIGFLFSAPIIGLLTEKRREKLWALIISNLLGLLVCYLFGTVWFALFLGNEVGFWTALITCVLPFVPFDVVKIVLASLLVKKIHAKIKMEQ